MKTSQQLHRYRLIKSVTEKLHPKRFPKMSGRMAAVVAFLIDQQVTRPTIIEIVVTSDRFVLAGLDDEVGANHLVGTTPTSCAIGSLYSQLRCGTHERGTQRGRNLVRCEDRLFRSSRCIAPGFVSALHERCINDQLRDVALGQSCC